MTRKQPAKRPSNSRRKNKKLKLIFLDRDGVINEFPGNGKYVTKVKDFHFIPGSLEAIRQLTEAGYTIFVVSNQAGVGKGLFTKEKLDRITNKLLKGVKRTNGKIRRVYYSIKKSDSGCPDRKPRIGSVEKAMKVLRKPLSAAKDAYFVGDTVSDIETGQNVGCKTILVLSGRESYRHLNKYKMKPDYVCKDLYSAVQEIILNEDIDHSRHSRSRAQSRG